METKRRVLVFGDTQLLRRLAAALRGSHLLDLTEYTCCEEVASWGEFQPDVILVDGSQVTPEQFQVLLACDPSSQITIISIDPLTYQITVLSSPCGSRPLTDVARIIEILSVSLSQPQ